MSKRDWLLLAFLWTLTAVSTISAYRPPPCRHAPVPETPGRAPQPQPPDLWDTERQV